MSTTSAIIARIHMELASPRGDRALVTRLLGTFTERAAAVELATTTADQIRAKLAWTDLTIPIRGRAQMTAWWILNTPDDAATICAELDTDGLAATCIALLALWCDACDRASARALATVGGTERGLEALLAPQDGSGDHTGNSGQQAGAQG